MDRPLAYGVYEATQNFRNCRLHSCVCYADDMGLVATTGPAEDRESQKYAELFAASPKLLEACRDTLESLDSEMLEYYERNEGRDIPAWMKAAAEQLRAAITQATGRGVIHVCCLRSPAAVLFLLRDPRRPALQPAGRTGSADFSKWLVTWKRNGGALPSHMFVRDGRLCDSRGPLETPEEADFFRAIGLEWIEPRDRTEGRWRK